MTDKELLELAAKAAGVVGDYVVDYNGDYYYQGNTEGILCELDQGGWRVWNPLADDGDALRLAVKLGFEICVLHDAEKTFVRDDSGITDQYVLFNGDPYAATRRAIVRAAAEIGKGMK